MPKRARAQRLCRGPHENYIDRDTGAPRRLYAGEVGVLQSPYVAPAENAGRGGVQWVALLPSALDTDTCGIIVSHAPAEADRPTQPWPLCADDKSHAASDKFLDNASVACVPSAGLHFSASYHSIMALLRAKHQHELEAGPCQLHIDGMHMGVGGDDSWTPSVRYCALQIPTSVRWKSQLSLFALLTALSCSCQANHFHSDRLPGPETYTCCC